MEDPYTYLFIDNSIIFNCEYEGYVDNKFILNLSNSNTFILCNNNDYIYLNKYYKYFQSKKNFMNTNYFVLVVKSIINNIGSMYTNVNNNQLLVNFRQLVNYLPNSIKYLKLLGHFNKSIDNLSNSIEDLMLGDYFNLPVDNLPSSITNLKFGMYFNKSVDNLPSSIINLTFDYSFDQLVDNLPNSIINLIFGYSFNKPINNLPSSIINLKLGYKFCQNISNLPESIQNLTIYYYYDHKIYKLPKMLTHVHINGLDHLFSSPVPEISSFELYQNTKLLSNSILQINPNITITS